jgi:alkylation response protein AidB-like acyl-CoA dehydrogenase
VNAFDPDVRWTDVVLESVAADDVVVLGERWADGVAAARLALAAELIGISQAMLAVAIEHTSARVQYGRTIASFQAVRHRLAEAHAEVVGCAALLEAAWADDSAWGAAVAKQAAGHLQQKVSRHALQVCGAMGLSEEFTLHCFVTRAVVLDSLYLPHQQLDRQLGRELLNPENIGRPLARMGEL